jgi:hypothetical protein
MDAGGVDVAQQPSDHMRMMQTGIAREVDRPWSQPSIATSVA